jgi:ubiquinone/menaquinone biosynthesis C-methylase UbiE
MAKLGPDKREGYKKVEIVEGYDKWASTYDEQRNPLIVLEEDVTLDFIGDVKDRKVLDIGCGTGRYCELLARRGAEVVGLDPSSRMLDCAKKKITTELKFELRLGGIEEAEFPTNHFNVVLSVLTLGHIPKLEPVIKKISHVIKSRGKLIVSDIHPYWPISGHNYTEFFDRSGQEYRIPEYAHLLEEYWNLFKTFKFDIEDVREPKIDDKLIEHFPELKEWKGIPLPLILKAKKGIVDGQRR